MIGQYEKFVILSSFDKAANCWIEYEITKEEKKQHKQEKKEFKRSDRNGQLPERYGQ